ncbi:MAG: methylenetetrahydrofolate--tRNA-(uracil(54)-C(5))-methyltransferase (FADH(2)-oxidizing) TrmFO [Verrucomicrobiota bacterium]
MQRNKIKVIGGGLAGSEAAWQVAEAGCQVELYEMRPEVKTPAHRTSDCAEVVCSNSFGSKLEDRSTGVLLHEMRSMNSHLVQMAEKYQVPAGGALAVDREAFSSAVTHSLEAHPNITLIRTEVKEVPEEGITVIASGPLTSDALAESIGQITGEDYLYFYDALAPIVERDSIDDRIAFAASRYERDSGEGDYINCPFTEEEYNQFIDALVAAESIPLKEFEQESDQYFEGCLPVEVMASRGRETLAYGPMRPVGLIDPRTDKRPHAVVQLRKDNAAGTLYNLVGFQTNIKWGQQEEVLRMIPGLGTAHFIRFGQMHRNTFINSPTQLSPTMQSRKRPNLFFAGQITGMEGYLGNVASGLLAGINAARLSQGLELIELPPLTMLGALSHYITSAEPEHFQPMKANFGLMPDLPEKVRGKRNRMAAHAKRSRKALEDWMAAGEANQFE